MAHYKQLNSYQIGVIQRERREGRTMQDIADRHGYSVGTVWRHTKDVPRHPNHRFWGCANEWRCKYCGCDTYRRVVCDGMDCKIQSANSLKRKKL